MSKLVFVTAPTSGGKSRYIRENRTTDSVVFDEVLYSAATFRVIERELRAGRDVYVSWILPGDIEIEWVQADKLPRGVDQ